MIVDICQELSRCCNLYVMNANLSDFAASLHKTRIKACLSLEELAEGICSPSYLSLIEAGKRNPSQKVINALSLKLGIAPVLRVIGTKPSSSFIAVEASIRLGDFSYAKRAISQLEDSNEKLLASGLLSAAQGSFAKAISSFELCKASSARDSWLHFRANFGLIKTHRDSGSFQQAISLGEICLGDFGVAKFSTPDEIVELRAILASAYLEIGDLGRARELSRLPANSAAGNWQKAMSLWSEAMIEESAGNILEASHAAEQALSFVKALDRPLAEARLLNISASMELQLDSPDLAKASKEIAEAERILRGNSYTADLAACLATKAELASFSGNKELTQSLYSESLALLGDSGHESKGRIQAAAANSFLRLGETKECMNFLLLARETLESNGADRNAAKVWHLMGQIYEEMGDSAAALACLKASTELLGMPTNSRNGAKSRF